jgi:hypothetical protein
MLFAVNGTLMRGLALNQNLIDAGVEFVREDRTAPISRLWPIEDKYPAMRRVKIGGAEIEIELWDLRPDIGVLKILQQEPPGLVVGRVKLSDGGDVFGVLAEPYVIEVQIEITAFGGWWRHVHRK